MPAQAETSGHDPEIRNPAFRKVLELPFGEKSFGLYENRDAILRATRRILRPGDAANLRVSYIVDPALFTPSEPPEGRDAVLAGIRKKTPRATVEVDPETERHIPEINVPVDTAVLETFTNIRTDQYAERELLRFSSAYRDLLDETDDRPTMLVDRMPELMQFRGMRFRLKGTLERMIREGILDARRAMKELRITEAKARVYGVGATAIPLVTGTGVGIRYGFYPGLTAGGGAAAGEMAISMIAREALQRKEARMKKDLFTRPNHNIYDIAPLG